MNGGMRLAKETVLIVGLGEIGHTLFALYSESKEKFSVYGLDLDMEKMKALGQSKEKFQPKLTPYRFVFHAATQKNSRT